MTKRPHPQQEAIIELWEEGVIASAIAARLGLSKSTVTSFAQRNRHLCPARGKLKPLVQEDVPGDTSIAKRTIHVPSVNITGNLAPSFTPVSVAAFSWDAQA